MTESIVEAKLNAAKIQIPPPAMPTGIYTLATSFGNLLFLAGHGPLRPDKTLICGRVGEAIDTAGAYAAARVTAINSLATIKHYLGSLDHVVRPLKVLGLVRAIPEFTQQTKVIDGYTDVLRIAYGNENLPARSAIGVASLPEGICVEVEAIFEINPDFRKKSAQ
jgi:enamine deaminase RidA (YjgF/YER057c/UK114 family)